MTDQHYVYAMLTLIAALAASQMFRRQFDPFAPVWLFLCGFLQIYVVQAITCRDYALRARGVELVTRANLRALGALLWFLAVYYCGISRLIAARLPRPPERWSTPAVCTLAPLMIAWGLFSANMAMSRGEETISAEESLLRQFPMTMLVGSVLLIVTGRQPSRPRPVLTAAGVAGVLLYIAIWMFNAKRSHSLFGVLAGVCAWYVPRLRRPSLPMLAATGFAAVLVVSLAIGWRGNRNYDQSSRGFVRFAREFDPGTMLVNLSLKARAEEAEASDIVSLETEEYGGFLLMLDTVPLKAAYDYGSSYLRVFSTYIPRLVWPSKPLFGRQQWIDAWMAGSEFARDETFTGPAIGLLGATQLNGGWVATAIVVGVLALGMRTAYDYYRYHAQLPWAQAWWAVTYFNAWLTTANDDPLVWFYYNYGHTTLPFLAFLFLYHKLGARGAPSHAAPSLAPAAA